MPAGFNRDPPCTSSKRPGQSQRAMQVCVFYILRNLKWSCITSETESLIVNMWVLFVLQSPWTEQLQPGSSGCFMRLFTLSTRPTETQWVEDLHRDFVLLLLYCSTVVLKSYGGCCSGGREGCPTNRRVNVASVVMNINTSQFTFLAHVSQCQETQL